MNAAHNPAVTRLAHALRPEGGPALGVFLPAGFPNWTAGIDLLHSFAHQGAGVLEVGVPTISPVLDGPAISAAYDQALRQGVRMTHVMSTVRHAAESGTPVVVMSYWSSVSAYGAQRFAGDLAAAGAAGAMIPDLPLASMAPWLAAARTAGICTPQFIPRDVGDTDLARLGAAASGWMYAPAVAAATGFQGALDLTGMQHFTRRLRSHVRHPLVAGVGISTPARARAIAPLVDGVVIGSPIVRPLLEQPGKPGHAHAGAQVRQFTEALRDAAPVPRSR